MTNEDITVEDELYLHNDTISKFNNELYKDIFTSENIVSSKKSITFNGEKFYGFFLEKDKEKYFMISEFIDKLPLKVKVFKEGDYKGDVFKFVGKVESIIIPAEKRMEFRKLVDIMPMFQHTNPLHFKLFKLVSITAYIDRINVRTSTDAGFGKDSVVNIIMQLVNSTKNIYGATFAKLEYSLTNKLIILNEMGNLKEDDKHNMQEFLLATGAYFNDYTKRSRKTNNTQEQYDISKLSLLVFYNLPDYYINKSQEYFDQLFTQAVINRFIPFVFDGRLTTNFGQVFDIDDVMIKHKQTYKDIIATLNYFKQNNVKEIKYKVDKSLTFPDTLKRYERTFNTILKYVSEYAESQEEFDELSKELYKCYKRYDRLLIKDKEMK